MNKAPKKPNWELLCMTSEDACPKRAWSTCRRAVYYTLLQVRQTEEVKLAMDYGKLYTDEYKTCSAYIGISDTSLAEAPMWWGRL